MPTGNQSLIYDYALLYSQYGWQLYTGGCGFISMSTSELYQYRLYNGIFQRLFSTLLYAHSWDDRQCVLIREVSLIQRFLKERLTYSTVCHIEYSCILCLYIYWKCTVVRSFIYAKSPFDTHTHAHTRQDSTTMTTMVANCKKRVFALV